MGKEERLILVWLAREDSNQLGECDCDALRRLVARKLVKIDAVTGIDQEYWNVACTDKGYRIAATLTE